MAGTVRAGLGRSQEPATLHEPPMEMTNTHALGPSSAVFANALAGSWIRSGTGLTSMLTRHAGTVGSSLTR